MADGAGTEAAAERVSPMGDMGARTLAFSSIPVIDISALSGDDLAMIAATADEIGRACETVGFFYIKNHGIPQALIDQTYALSRRFHASPTAQKTRVNVRHSQGVLGWNPVTGEDEDEDRELYRLFEPRPGGDYLTKPHLNSAYNYMREIAHDDPDYLAGNVMLTPNLWPDWIPGFREQAMDYYDAVTAVGQRLFRAFALRLGLPLDFFEQRTARSPSILRLLHYPPNDLPMDNDNLGIGAHSDFECFTILHQGGTGLQVMNADDEWVAAPPIEGTFIVNIGDMLEGWTNGRFKATQHRVVNTGRERWSMPLFFAADYHTIVEPLPAFVRADNPPKYNRIVAGEHLASFVIAGAKHLRKKLLAGELKIDFPIHQENPFKRGAVNEYVAPPATDGSSAAKP
jgi:isopenicillin N synthase-like dioxygenase